MPVIIEPEASGEMTFAEIRQEVYDRGFSSLEQQEARVNRWINQAYREIIDFAPWPFLEASFEDTSPLQIEGLGRVLSVDDMLREVPLRYLDRRTLTTSWDPSLTAEAEPSYWYRDGENTVVAWPKNETNPLLVRFRLVPPRLVADEDKPYIPTDYCGFIVDGAVIQAYKNRDAYASATELRNEWLRGMQQMVHALLTPNDDRERKIERTGIIGTYL